MRRCVGCGKEFRAVSLLKLCNECDTAIVSALRAVCSGRSSDVPERLRPFVRQGIENLRDIPFFVFPDELPSVLETIQSPSAPPPPRVYAERVVTYRDTVPRDSVPGRIIRKEFVRRVDTVVSYENHRGEWRSYEDRVSEYEYHVLQRYVANRDDIERWIDEVGREWWHSLSEKQRGALIALVNECPYCNISRAFCLSPSANTIVFGGWTVSDAILFYDRFDVADESDARHRAVKYGVFHTPSFVDIIATTLGGER